MPKGGASCFVFLTALEVLKACENEDNDTAMAFSLDFALLYQYAREKVWKINVGSCSIGLVKLINFFNAPMA